jgi:aspartyl-tRNA synthetase
VIFLDLRDRKGLLQVVADPDVDASAHEVAEKIRGEFVVTVRGEVRKRPEGSQNPNLPSGDVEIAASEIVILNPSETPPFPIEDDLDTSEELRIKYRYLDLRRPRAAGLLALRHRVIAAIRSFLDSEGFVEIETPVLTRATPEGARDFLVPSRLEPGSFFALPQSPQLFKQLLMIGGIDRYYQIARCFRDEDPRSDRQLDFTQLDLEMSFVDEEQVMALTESLFTKVVQEAVGGDLITPFARLTYDEAISRYGTDAPDLRFGLEIHDLSDVFRGTDLKVFRSTLDEGGVAVGLVVEGGAGWSRAELDSLIPVAKNRGVGGLAWMAFKPEGLSSPIEKFLKPEEVERTKEVLGAKPGDLVLIVCDKNGTAQAALGSVRLEIADRGDLRAKDTWNFAWITDIPLVEWNPDEDRWDAVHHPFTAPRVSDIALMDSDPGAVKGRAYDIVLNGWEVGGGSIRIHDLKLQRKVFELIGITDEAARDRFGWFLEAFRYGVPPHGGIAPGIDRLVARLAGLDNIRDVIAFPKTGAYTDPLTGAPSRVEAETLAELGLKVLEEE